MQGYGSRKESKGIWGSCCGSCKRFWNFLKSSIPLIFGKETWCGICSTGTLSLLNTATKVSLPIVLFYTAPAMTGNADLAALSNMLIIGGGFATSFVLGKVGPSIKNLAILDGSTRVSHKTAGKILKKFFDLSLEHRLTARLGQIIGYRSASFNAVNNILPSLFVTIIPGVIETAAVTIIFVAIGHWYDGLGLAGMCTVFTGATVVGALIKNKTHSRYMRELIPSYGQFSSTLDNYENTHYSGRVAHEIQQHSRMSKRIRKGLNINEGARHISTLVQSVVTAVGTIGIFSGIIFGRDTTSMTYILQTFYLFQAVVMLDQFPAAVYGLSDGLIGLNEITKFLEKKPTIREMKDSRPLEINKNNAEISFNNVGFSYNKRGQAVKVLDGVSFKIPVGKKTAIVGITGAGKSTIVRLLFRFYDPSSGTITVNNQDIKTVQLSSLRDSIAVVPQDPSLFNSTLGANIKYVNLNAHENWVNFAIDQAGLSEYVGKLPQKLGTMVGARGLKISGGERQRVAIARAYLKNPNIYVFDEPTSSLDSRTENRVIANLDRISADTTTVFITHRLGTITNADQIIVLKDGKVAEVGDYKTLIENKGVFCGMMEEYCKNFDMNPEDIKVLPKPEPIVAPWSEGYEEEEGEDVQIRVEDSGDGAGKDRSKNPSYGLSRYSVVGGKNGSKKTKESDERTPLIVNEEDTEFSIN